MRFFLTTSLIAFGCPLLAAAPVPKMKETPKPKTVFEYAKELAKEKPAWKLTSVLKEWKGKALVEGGDFPIDKEFAVRTTWIILGDKMEIDLDKTKLSGGYKIQYGEKTEQIKFNKTNEEKRLPSIESNHDNQLWLERAKVSKATNGLGTQFVTFAEIQGDKKYRIVAVQQQITIDDGKKLHVYYGLFTIAMFRQMK